MPKFEPLHPDVIRKLLEGQEDVLSPLAEKENVLFKNSRCPGCGAYEHERSVDARRPFTPGSPLANKILRCLSCRAEFDPTTGQVLRAGEPDSLS